MSKAAAITICYFSNRHVADTVARLISTDATVKCVDLTSDTLPYSVYCMVLFDQADKHELRRVVNLRNAYSERVFFAAFPELSLSCVRWAMSNKFRQVYQLPFDEHQRLDLLGHLNPEFKSTNRSSGTDSFNQRFIRAVEIIDAYYDSKLRLRSIADNLNVSESRMAHVIKDGSGICFQKYICMRRLESALTRIVESKEGLNSIAYDLGFSSPSHFSRNFRNYFSISPSHYAKFPDQLELSAEFRQYLTLRRKLASNYRVELDFPQVGALWPETGS